VSGLDRAALRWMRTRGHSPATERAVRTYSKLGVRSYLWVAVSAAGWAFDTRNRPVYKRTLRAVAADETVNFLIKLVVRRPRPKLDGLPPLMDTATSLSYPSAHASSSFAAARTLSTVLPSTVTYAAALAMALTRPYLGVHYPSDIVAGAVLGFAIAQLVPE
jgi:membrane-associated phospholipid phosphatase